MDYQGLKAEMGAIAELLKQFPEAVQPRVFDMLVSTFLGESVLTPIHGPLHQSPPPAGNAKKELLPEVSTSSVQSRKRTPSKESYTILKELNLRGDDQYPSFREFIQLKQPRSNVDFNTVAVYYLSFVRRLENIGLSHLFTCYKEVNRKVPEKLRQSVWDTSGARYGYLDASDMNNIRVPTRGQNRVEHELPDGGQR